MRAGPSREVEVSGPRSPLQGLQSFGGGSLIRLLWVTARGVVRQAAGLGSFMEAVVLHSLSVSAQG